MREPFTLRPLTDAEQPQALTLWYTVFHETPGFFERYYSEADPGYRAGDTMGAWDGDRLISAVHICRRHAAWAGGTLLCGAIANVATLPDYRRRGLSRRLLEMAIATMEAGGFHFSLLGTGVPDHYAALGWQQTFEPSLTLRLHPNVPAVSVEWWSLDSVAELADLYRPSARPLQFVRPTGYFEGWVVWNWRRRGARVAVLPGQGYLIAAMRTDPNASASVIELCADDAAGEQALLRVAVGEARRTGHNLLSLERRPQSVGDDFLATLGVLETHTGHGAMARNIGLPAEQFQQLREAYQTGRAVWWPGDAF